MIKNDEPVYEDALGYYAKVRNVGHRILGCSPPYVIGICGSWGAGKTSFLKMLWAYMGGEVERPDGKLKLISDAEHEAWFGESRNDFDRLRADASGNRRKIELVWFNPWQHQFEASPLVALLNEIRQHFSVTRKLFNHAGKLADVTTHALLNSMGEIARSFKLPTARVVLERGREYEDENFLTALGSQRFRDFFESAIKQITHGRGLLVIFIDDLDRCEGEVAYRLLESLKLYLNARNCVYVLGLDQQHLESSIARALTGERELWEHRPKARDYLSKMFQSNFHLPVPSQTRQYIESLLAFDEDGDFREQLQTLFNFNKKHLPLLVETLDENLPHNPRKIKSFISSWKLYLDALQGAGLALDWRLTLILQYLAHFEEPLFRRIEQALDFYNDELVPYCKTGYTNHPLFSGLELPYVKQAMASESDRAGGLGSRLSGAEFSASQSLDNGKDQRRPLAEPRIFWISRLVNQLASQHTRLDGDDILRHLLQVTPDR
jgi:hypothetical protein